VCSALADTDDRVVWMGLAAARESCPEAAISLVVQKATSAEMEEQRLAAIAALGEAGRPAALEALLRMSKPKRRSLLGFKTSTRGKDSVAVIRALRGYETDQRAKRALELAAKSRDPLMVRAARGEG
jgi:hypothetical protein